MKTKRLFVRSRWVGLLLIGLFCAALQMSAATVRGRITNFNGYPIPGIWVRVFTPGLGYSNFSASGPDGMYYLNGIPAGGYRLEFWYNNQLIQQFPITVSEPLTDIAPIQI